MRGQKSISTFLRVTDRFDVNRRMAKKVSSRKMGININEISSSRFAALIPAAGYSSRMGFFKPLLPLGKSLAIARTVDTFRQAGLEDIRVITGYKQELLTPVLNRLGVTVLTNPGFSAGMYSSIQAGVSTLEDAIDAFFLLPGDCPLVKPGTIHALMAAYLRDPSSVIYPVYEGRRGHPPLLCARLRRLIAEHSPENGLNSLLEDYIHDFREVPVEDPNIHLDMDTALSHMKIDGDELVPFPSADACIKLLENAGTSPHIILHAREVARIAVSIAEELNSRGSLVHLGVVLAAGLLHDIARVEADHAGRGQQIVSAFGYDAVADVIAVHTDLPSRLANTVNEAGIVYLADKMVHGNRVVSLKERFARALNKYGNDTGAGKKAGRDSKKPA